MNWQRYQNELIVLVAFLIMLGAYMYKHNHVVTQAKEAEKIQRSIEELKEVITLKKIWSDKNLNKKLDAFHAIIPASKVKWMKKKQKIEAKYIGLNAQEINKLTSKILNLPVEITQLAVKKVGSLYNVEFACKW